MILRKQKLKIKHHKRFLRQKAKDKRAKSYYDINFSSKNVRLLCKPFRYIHKYHKSFFHKTKSTILAKHFTKSIFFSSTNTLMAYAFSWDKIWRSRVTHCMDQYIEFLGDDMKIFNFFRKRYIKVRRSWRDKNYFRRETLYRLLSLYLEFSFRTLLYLYKYCFHQNTQNELVLYRVYLTFTANRLFINMVSKGGHRYNYLSLSVGLFLKFFKNKKSFKKNKLVKILLMRYLRKLLIATSIRDVALYVKRTPVFFLELCNAFTTPVITPFLHPFIAGSYNDTDLNTKSPFTALRHIVFSRSKPYGLMKGPRKGRLKRKIMRRIIRTNRVCD